MLSFTKGLKLTPRVNVVPNGLEDLDDVVIGREMELRCDPGLLWNLWEAPGLPCQKKRRVKQDSLLAVQ